MPKLDLLKATLQDVAEALANGHATSEQLVMDYLGMHKPTPCLSSEALLSRW